MYFTYRMQRTFEGRIGLDRDPGEVEPPEAEGQYGHAPEEIEPLSLIIRELNERFGLVK